MHFYGIFLLQRQAPGSTQRIGIEQVSILSNEYGSEERTTDDQAAVILKKFDEPDEVTRFARAMFETVTLGGMTIGRAIFKPGWKWSDDVGPDVGEQFAPSSMSAW